MFKNFNAMMREEKGFSMIELIIVIAIIGIIGAVVAPMFGSATLNANVNADVASANTIQTALDLRFATQGTADFKDGTKLDQATGVTLIEAMIHEDRIARNTDTVPQTEAAVYRYNNGKRRFAVDFEPAIEKNDDVQGLLERLPVNQQGYVVGATAKDDTSFADESDIFGGDIPADWK